MEHFKQTIGFGLGLVVVCGGLYLGGKFLNHLEATVGKERINIQRENFKESIPYVEGMIQKLSDARRDYETTKDPNEKEQIANLINIEFANFDPNKIEDQGLYNFLEEIREGLK